MDDSYPKQNAFLAQSSILMGDDEENEFHGFDVENLQKLQQNMDA